MNRDDIIRMAEESTPDHMIGGCEFDYAQLEHFANLVAAAEREACAKVCENIATETYGMTNLREYGECAEAIRERGAP
jgi:hypothetical protein